MTVRTKQCGGFGLIDCLVYITLLMVIAAIAFAAFYETLEHSTRLNRAAAEIMRATQAGERWRAEVREAIGPPKITEAGGQTVFELPFSGGVVQYRFADGAVQRQVASNANWTVFLAGVKNSRMHIDQRQFVTSCRWELELATGKKPPRVKPLFTFQAANSPSKKATP